jgi:hypothetical protein
MAEEGMGRREEVTGPEAVMVHQEEDMADHREGAWRWLVLWLVLWLVGQ